MPNVADGTQIRGPEEFAEAFSVSRETIGRLVIYADLLKTWQKTINLVAPSTLPEIWPRHMADSAQLLPMAPKGALKWLDLGSGAGFPGLVLALLLAETGQARVTLVESDNRKAAFLREVARKCGVAVDILCGRIESPSTHAKVGKVDVVTARALAPLSHLLGLAHPFFTKNTNGLFLKGQDVEGEIKSARANWSFSAELVPSCTNPLGRIAVITDLECKPEG